MTLKSDKKKVLIFSLAYYPNLVGGAEVAIKEITDRIEDYEFHMITLGFDKDLPKKEMVGNVLVHRIGFTGKVKSVSDTYKFPLFLNKYLIFPLGFLKALSLHKTYKYDIVWSMMASYNAFAALFFKFFNKNVKYLLTLQEGDPIEHIKKRARIVWPIFKSIFQKADHIQVISTFLKDFAYDMGYEKDVSIVPNGVDFDYFKNVDQFEVDKIKTLYDKKEGDVWLITTSRLVEKNDIETVIDTVMKMSKNVKFFILGTGELEKELMKKAKDHNLHERVFFLGYIPHDKMRYYLHASDIFIRPSLSEGFGNSFIEAMAVGIPVVATEVGGIPDFIKHKITGVIVGVCDTQDILLKVEMLLRDKALKEEIVDNAMEMVKTKYDWNHISESMKVVFEKTLT